MSMNLDDMYPSKWLRAADLGSKTHRVTIDSIEMEHFQDGTSKPAMQFKGKSKGMVLNKTNATAIAGAYGKDAATWVGKDIEIFSMKVQGPSGLVDGIRVRVPEGGNTEPAQGAVTGDLNDEIPFSNYQLRAGYVVC